MSTRGGVRDRERLRDRVLGGPRRLGWWTLPLFVAVGLLGAVLAGSLAAVYYAQQVARLERETAEARNALTDAVDDVRQAGDEAIAEIESEVEAVRDQLAGTPPLEEEGAAGVLAVRVTLPDGSVRVGSAVSVVEADGATFAATAFGLVADPQQVDVPLPGAVVLAGGQARDATVHSWDPPRGLALLRVADWTGAPILEWRPPDDTLTVGDGGFAVGRSTDGPLLQAPIELAATPPDLFLLDRVTPGALWGGGLVDGSAQVVGVLTEADRAIRIQAVCQQLVRCPEGDRPPAG